MCNNKLVKKLKASFAPILILVVVLMLGVIGFAGYQYYKMYTGGPIAKIPSELFYPSPTPDQIANWKTYRNEEHGFEFRYPDDWVIETSKVGFSITNYKSSRDPISYNIRAIFIIYDTEDSKLLKDTGYLGKSYQRCRDP